MCNKSGTISVISCFPANANRHQPFITDKQAFIIPEQFLFGSGPVKKFLIGSEPGFVYNLPPNIYYILQYAYDVFVLSCSNQ
jgi:hypothetical protein